MSGGRFDYKNDYLCDEIFGYDLSPDYDLENSKLSRKAAKKNPLEDRVISEIVYDVFCLLHSFDWYASGDNCEDTYLEDVEYFKTKWLKCDNKDLAKRITDESIEDCKEELYKALGIISVGIDEGTKQNDSMDNEAFDIADDEEEIYRMTTKGIAAIAMVESGILSDIYDPKIDGFYNLFEKYMRKAGYVHDPEEE